MIIRLKNATFSNNIGTLTTWGISWKGDGIASTGLVTLVDKNAPFNATVSIDSKYTSDNVPVKVEMYDNTSNEYVDITTNSGVVSRSSSGITINIASVTGKLRITIGEVASGGGDNGESGEALTEYLFKDQSFVGYLRGGVYVASANSATTDYIDISSKPKIGYYGRMGYVSGDTFHALEFYDANKTYIPELSELGTGAPALINLDLSDAKYANAKYVRASVSRSSYTVEQFNMWYFVVGGYAVVRDTLTTTFPIQEYIALDGTFVEASSGAYRTDYVALAGKSKIEYTGRMGTIGLNIAFYNSSKQFISGLETIGNGNLITKTINLTESQYANAAYVVASISRGSLSEADWNKSSFAIS